VKRYQVIITPQAQEDFERLQDFWLKVADADTAERALETIIAAFDALAVLPHSCRKASASELGFDCRELVIKFGRTGYLALFEIREAEGRVVIVAVRHQREADYH
jgi:plasmid stabilization system protein ParE